MAQDIIKVIALCIVPLRKHFISKPTSFSKVDKIEIFRQLNRDWIKTT